MPASPHPQLTRWQWRSLFAAAVGAIACAIGGLLATDQFLRSWLVAWVFWMSLSLGSLALLLIQSLVRSRWGPTTRRIFVSGAETLPLMALLFLPVFFAPERLYEWARPEAVSHDEILQHKQAYLNPEGFRLRAGVYLGVWVGILLLVRRRLLFDREHPAADRLESIPLRGPALAVLVLTASFAAFDWTMSLEPRWYSSIYGAIYASEGLLGGFAATVLVFAALRDRTGFAAFASPQLFNDLGNLLLAFVMIWGYLEFSQFLIIWSGNLPDEAVWYVRRFAGGWQWLIVASVAFHLVVPFCLLLSRDVKRHAARLAGIAGLLLAMRYVENFWTVAPAFSPERLVVHWLDLAAPLAIGGVWVAFVSLRIKAHVSDIAPPGRNDEGRNPNDETRMTKE